VTASPGRSRWGLLVAGLVVVGAIAYLALAGIGNALVFYLTPSELLARGDQARAEVVRLGGLVKPGSVQGPATDLRFVITDGAAELTVHSSVAPTDTFREGIGVIVEGRLASSGIFEAIQVLVKHDENYVAPEPGERPGGVYLPPAD
jgi:cytochrome c-type biogenesis protein CcmE